MKELKHMDFSLKIGRNRELPRERNYNQCVEELDQLEVDAKTQKYETVMEEVDNILSAQHREEYHSLITKEFQLELICLQVQDKFSYFNLVLCDQTYQAGS